MVRKKLQKTKWQKNSPKKYKQSSLNNCLLIVFSVLSSTPTIDKEPKYPFVLVFGITVTKRYSAVILHDATSRGTS